MKCFPTLSQGGWRRASRENGAKSLTSTSTTPTTVRGHGAGTTFVVHVGGQLHTAEGRVHPQVAEVRVGLQDKLSPQLHVLATRIPLIDQEGVVIVKLGQRRMGQTGAGGQRPAECERKRNGAIRGLRCEGPQAD